MASARVAPKAVSLMGAASRQAVRPALRSVKAQPAQRSFSAATQRISTPIQSAMKRQQATTLLKNNAVRAAFGRQATRPYSSEMAQALVEVSQNLGMGTAAVGLGGAGIGIGLVFGALILAVARNPSVRGQLFTYAILGFAFCEAMGLFDLMVAMMAKFI